jgi:hypothetical protein
VAAELAAAREEVEAAVEAAAVATLALATRPTHEQVATLRGQVEMLQTVGGWDADEDASAGACVVETCLE